MAMEAVQSLVRRIYHAEGYETVRDLLGATRIHDLNIPARQVTLLQALDTVGDAMKALAENNVTSAPVISISKEGGMENVLGFLDVKDILWSFLSGLSLQEVHDEKLMHRMRDLEEKGATFSAIQLKDLKYLGMDGDFIHETQAKQGSLLELVLKCFIEPRSSSSANALEKRSSIVHRVACFNSKGHVTHIISQSDVIKFLSTHVPNLGKVASRTLSELGLVGKSLETVSPETPAIDALAVCADKNVSGLPVVGAQGELLGNFSVKDLRNINPEHFGALALPVAEFLALEHHTEFIKFNRPSDSGSPENPGHRFAAHRRQACATLGRDVGQSLFAVTPESKLVEVLELLSKYRTHTVYIVDADKRPVGVVTCTDVLNLALKN